MTSQGDGKLDSWWTALGLIHLKLCVRLLALEGEWSGSLLISYLYVMRVVPEHEPGCVASPLKVAVCSVLDENDRRF